MNSLRAFTLIEMLVVIVVIAILCGIAVPVSLSIRHNAQSVACLSNIRQIGIALNLYLGENNMILPDLRAGRSSKAEDVPVIDNTLDRYVSDPKVFACPADKQHLAEETGTSYYWNNALSNQPLASLNFLSVIKEKSRIPILSDKEGFHPDTANKVNVLYADGHATKDLKFSTSQQ